MDYPSFNSLVRSEFAFLNTEFGCNCSFKKETWLLSVIFDNGNLKIDVELGDKEHYFNVLVSLGNELSQVPLWAICKVEKLDAGIIVGSIIENNSLESMCVNSNKALVELLPRIVQYGRTERRKIEHLIQKQAQTTLNK